MRSGIMKTRQGASNSPDNSTLPVTWEPKKIRGPPEEKQEGESPTEGESLKPRHLLNPGSSSRQQIFQMTPKPHALSPTSSGPRASRRTRGATDPNTAAVRAVSGATAGRGRRNRWSDSRETELGRAERRTRDDRWAEADVIVWRER